MNTVAIAQDSAPADVISMPADALATVVHDLRQPLSSIETIAFYLSMVVPPADVRIQAQLARIRELVQESNEILARGLQQPAAPPCSDDSGN